MNSKDKNKITTEERIGYLFSPEPPIITIKEAQKILGKEANLFSSEELIQLIDELDQISRILINSNLLIKD